MMKNSTRDQVNQSPTRQTWPGSDMTLNPPADHGEKSYRGSQKLKDKVAIITGGDSGIGRAVALAFAREGADVAFSYFDEWEDAQVTRSLVEDAGRKSLAIPGDLIDPKHSQEIVAKTLEEFGKINILINNAGYQNELKD